MKYYLLVLSILTVIWPGFENYLNAKGKPPTNFGRIVKVSKVFDVEDKVWIDSRESTFVRDHDQIIEFNANGTFQRNYFKKGVGPGELFSVANFFLVPGEIVVLNNRPRKILHFNKTGSFLKERPVNLKLFSPRLLLYANNQYLLVSKEIPKIKGEEAFVEHQQPSLDRHLRPKILKTPNHRPLRPQRQPHRHLQNQHPRQNCRHPQQHPHTPNARQKRLHASPEVPVAYHWLMIFSVWIIKKVEEGRTPP